MRELNKEDGKFQLLYWLIVIAVITLIGVAVSWKFVWVIGIAAGVLVSPIGKAIQKGNYKRVIEKERN